MFRDAIGLAICSAGLGFLLGIFILAPEKPPTNKQILICSTGVGAPATVVGAGYIERLRNGEYRIRMPYTPDQIVDKGMMDICVIANPQKP